MEKGIYTKDYATFLECLRQARKAAGLTQEQLAEKIGTTQSVVSKFERGERRIDIVELRVICKAMGIRLQQFVMDMESAIETGNKPDNDHLT